MSTQPYPAMPLETHGLSAPPIVFGCMTLGGDADQAIDEVSLKRARAAVDAALENGMTFFDHADIYARGKSETIFGRLLKERKELREQIVLQSKCGIRFKDDTAPTRYDFSREHIMTSVEGTLSRLGIEQLDILLLHRPDPLMEPDEVAEAFAQLKAKGMVRHLGVSNMSVAQMRLLQNALPDPLVVNQMQMSLARLDWVDQDVHVNQAAGERVHFAEGLLEYCRMEDVQVQAWSPLAKGLFSGRLADDAHEHHRVTAALVQEMAAEKQTTAEAIVLGWLMKHPARVQPVIGTTHPTRIRACADAPRQAQIMTREEWYTLYVSARGRTLP